VSDSLDDWGGAEFVLAADRLDTPDVIEAADPGDMLRQVASAAAGIRIALRSCLETDLSGFTPDARPRAIVVAGQGDAGIAGEMLAAVVGPGSPVQIVAWPTGRLPGWVGAADVVIAVSGPGPAAETLAVATEAARRGCRLAGVGLPDSPLHRITEQARAAFVPIVPAAPATSPQPSMPQPSMPQPSAPQPSMLTRSMLWALAIPPLVIAERLGVARIGPDAYEQTARRLEEVSHQCRPASESFVNPGKSLALDLVGTLPLVWGTSALSEVAARRFAALLSENAKYPAIAGVLPEVAQNQIAAFDGPFAPSARPPADPTHNVGRADPADPFGRADPADPFGRADPADPFGRADPADPFGRSGRTSDPIGHSSPTDPTGMEDLASWDLDYDTGPGQASGFTPLRLVLISDPDADQRVASQLRAVAELAAQRGIGLSELAMDGEHPLVRLAGVIQLADYASIYLAIASGIDPGAVAAIADLQARIELPSCGSRGARCGRCSLPSPPIAASRRRSSSRFCSPGPRPCWPSRCTRLPTPATRCCCWWAAAGPVGRRQMSTRSASGASGTSTGSSCR
jgi:glucose/mannose-6-phosphate isomerase